MLKKLMLVIVLGLISAAWAQVEPSQIAQAVKRSIVLGDDLTQWEGLPQYQVYLSNDAEPQAVSSPGYFSLAWDDAYLYILGVFQQPQESLMADLSAEAEEWWLADTMEVFVRLPNEPEMLHFAANPAGVRFTSFLSSADYQTHATIGETSWSLQMAFPLGKNVLPYVTDSSIWDLKIGRAYVAASEYALWPVGRDFLAEDNFGKLVFTNELLDDASLQQKAR